MLNRIFICVVGGVMLAAVACGAASDIDALRAQAEQGDTAAQARLGDCYYKGNGVVADKAEAVKWYRKAAEQNDGVAQLILGNCYRYGHGVAKDHAEALKWYRKAAEHGEASAEAKEAIQQMTKK